MRHAYEDAVNENFVNKVGQVLANASAYGADSAWEYVVQLADLYETMIDNLPEPNEEENDE